MGGAGGDLAQRVAVALIGIPIVVGLAYVGGYALALFVGVFAAVAAWEFCAMNEGRGVASSPWLAALLGLGLVTLAAVVDFAAYPVWVAVLALVLATPMVLRWPTESKPALAVSVTLFAAFYTGGLLAFAVWLRELDSGAGWGGAAILFMPIALTWLGDSAAYFVGRAIGRRRLAPNISPNKTWEGAIAGLVTSVGAAVLFVELTRPSVGWTLPLAHVLALGAVISVGGQLGDLVESRFKRDCGVKDSSALLPGHGGFLDRIDSLLYAFPLAYAYLWTVGV